MTYEQFIEELREYLNQAHTLSKGERTYEDEEFKKWHHKVKDLILNIRKDGYFINSQIESRKFYSVLLSPTLDNSYEAKAFKSALQETVIELETIIENYEKYGEPEKSKTTDHNVKTNPNLPEKITLDWMYKHVPLKFWVSLLIGILFIFIVGLYTGQTAVGEFLENLIDKF